MNSSILWYDLNNYNWFIKWWCFEVLPSMLPFNVLVDLRISETFSWTTQYCDDVNNYNWFMTWLCFEILQCCHSWSTFGSPLLSKKPKTHNQVQVNLCQKLLFYHQLTHNMTTYCSMPENSNSEHGENMLCTEIDFDIQNNLCTQHVLPMFCKN